MSLDESLFLAINGLAGRAEFFDHLFLRLSATSTLYLPVALAAGYCSGRPSAPSAETSF